MESEPVSILTLPSPRSQQDGELSVADDWQAKLSSIQDQHIKLESVQQHQEHLEQLKRLQTQLLRELSSDKTNPSLQELCSPRQVGSKEASSLRKEASTDKDVSMSTEKQLTNSQGVFTPVQSLESLSLPHTSTLVKHSPLQSPAKSQTPHASPSKQPSVQNPAYKVFSPRLAWEGDAPTHSPQKSSLPMTPQSMTSQSPSTFRGDTTQSKLSLVAKHNKHVGDLKKYYESEILALRRQVEQVRPGGLVGSPLRGSNPSSPAQRQLKFTSLDTSSPAKDRTVESELWIMQSENERLNSTHAELQRRLDDAER